jgi:hypothetical protein
MSVPPFPDRFRASGLLLHVTSLLSPALESLRALTAASGRLGAAAAVAS